MQGCLHAVSRTMHTDQNIVIALRADSAELLNYLKGGGDGYGYKDGVSFSKKRDVDRQASKPTKPTINSHMGHWILIGATQ